MSMMPVILDDKMADFKMYRELVGGNLVEAAWAFYHADCDIDKALTAYDASQARLTSRFQQLKEGLQRKSK